MITGPCSSTRFAIPTGRRSRWRRSCSACLGVDEGDLATARPHQGLQAIRHARPRRHRRRVGAPGPRRRPHPTRPVPSRLRGVQREPRASCGPRTDARGRQLEVVEIQAPTSHSRRRRASSTGRTSTTTCATARSSCVRSAIRATQRRRRSSSKLYPGREVVAGRGPTDLRMRWRHPLHHPATAGGLIPLAVVVDRGELPTERRDDMAAARRWAVTRTALVAVSSGAVIAGTSDRPTATA